MNVPGLSGLAAGIEFIRQTGIDNLHKKEKELSEKLLKAFSEIPGVTVYSPSAGMERGAVVSITLEGSEPQDIAMLLDSEFDIAVRAGLHCAAYTHRALGTDIYGGTVRFSPGYFTTDDDVEKCIDAVMMIAREGAPKAIAACEHLRRINSEIITEPVLEDFNAVTAVIASYQSAEAVKIIVGSDDVCRDLRVIDLWDNHFDSVSVIKNESCPICSAREYHYFGKVSGIQTDRLCGRDYIQVVPPEKRNMDFEKLGEKLETLGSVSVGRFTLDFDSPSASFKLFRDGRAIVRRVESEGRAKTVYAEYIGF